MRPVKLTKDTALFERTLDNLKVPRNDPAINADRNRHGYRVDPESMELLRKAVAETVMQAKHHLLKLSNRDYRPVSDAERFPARLAPESAGTFPSRPDRSPFKKFSVDNSNAHVSFAGAVRARALWLTQRVRSYTRTAGPKATDEGGAVKARKPEREPAARGQTSGEQCQYLEHHLARWFARRCAKSRRIWSNARPPPSFLLRRIVAHVRLQFFDKHACRLESEANPNGRCGARMKDPTPIVGFLL